MNHKLLYLSRRDVESAGITMREIIAALEEMFREKGEGRVEMPPKPGIHPRPDAFIHAMPAYIPAAASAGMKWVSGYPQNQSRGLPYISGLLILNDADTGLPVAVMDCTWITAMRTGAASALAAKHLARLGSETLGILGCGVQGKRHVEALCEVMPLRRVLAYDVNPRAAQAFAEGATEAFGLEVIVVETPRRAVSGADIVVTAGPILKIPHATIRSGWLDRGSFASLVDYDSYWHPEALREVDKFCTDDLAQLEYYRTRGYFQNIPPVHAELGDLVVGRKAGRESEAERTMACNLGIALDDMATAPLIFRRALDIGLGTWLSL
jgi:ornithine cyclodeaminase/alanine dehydrogenase-like protein (mu-crystallin family)